MRHDLITVTTIDYNPNIEAFRNALVEKRLVFLASQLCNSGFVGSEQLLRAVEQAMKACIVSNLSVQDHFKAFYIADGNRREMIRDWKLSRLGFALVMLNGDAENPAVGKLQIELLKKYVSN